MTVPSTTIDIKKALSAPRVGTYEAVQDGSGNNLTTEQALELYAWNANVSAALLAPLHICEVVIRNAISEALEIKYGANWPWSQGFEQSLPTPNGPGYHPRKDLLDVRNRQATVGKVIPELKFAFWQKMFTSRHDQRLWNTHLKVVLPNIPTTQTTSQARRYLFDELGNIRELRNRIAHHEPVFSRNLADDFQKIHALVALRCNATASWMDQNQHASTLIAARPTF